MRNAIFVCGILPRPYGRAIHCAIHHLRSYFSLHHPARPSPSNCLRIWRPIGSDRGDRFAYLHRLRSAAARLPWHILPWSARGIHGARAPCPGAHTLRVHGLSLNNIVCLSAAAPRKAGSPKRIYIASTLALSGLAFLSIFYTDSLRTLGGFYAGCSWACRHRSDCRVGVKPSLVSLAVTATLTLVRVILPDVGSNIGVAAFFAVALVVGLRRATAIARKVLDLRARPWPVKAFA